MAKSWVTLGVVTGAVGLKGWVKVRSYTVPVDGLLNYETVSIHFKEGPKQEKIIAEGKIVNSQMQLKFKGIEDRNNAETLKGALIAISRKNLPPLEENEYYWYDLVGLEVVNRRRENFGRVKSLLPAGAHDVLVLEGGREKKELLIPFVSLYVDEVDVSNGIIRVNWEKDY